MTALSGPPGRVRARVIAAAGAKVWSRSAVSAAEREGSGAGVVARTVTAQPAATMRTRLPSCSWGSAASCRLMSPGS